MNDPEENDALWSLLGRAKAREVSPMFARNVLREVRQLQAQRENGWAWLQHAWKWAVPACAAAFVAAAVLLSHPSPPDQIAEIAEAVSESPDYLVIGDLDDLLASEESSVWLDNPGY